MLSQGNMGLGAERLSDAELVLRARRVRLLLSDVDGVLTDAGIYYSERGEELRRFSVRDGMGVELLRIAGIETALMTREDSAIVSQRARKLGLSKVYLGVRDKLSRLLSLQPELALSLENIAYIGDDVNDVPLLRCLTKSCLTAAPADAIRDARDAASFTTRAVGGQGAFREFADWILELRRKDTA